MRIVYGVHGEGMGHWTRSKVVIDHLLKKHEVRIFASSRAYEFLFSIYGKSVEEVPKIGLVYSEGRVHLTKTFLAYIRNRKNHIHAYNKMQRILAEYKPHVIITDFEVISAHVAQLLKIPLISVDNLHMLTKSRIDYSYKYLIDKIMAGIVLSFFVRNAYHYVIVSFFKAETKARNVTIVQSAIRDELRKLSPTRGKHFLVYQTSHDYRALIPVLKQFSSIPFIIYQKDKSHKDGNITYKPLHGIRFLKDLATCRGVITNGGFTLISESIYLRKPIFSLPLFHQFEQILNAKYLELLGYGMSASSFSVFTFQQFLEKLPYYERRLRMYHHDNNKHLHQTIDNLLMGIWRNT